MCQLIDFTLGFAGYTTAGGVIQMMHVLYAWTYQVLQAL